MPLKIIVDSNFLMIPPQFHLDIFSELKRALNRNIKVIIISPVYDELKKISLIDIPKYRKQAEMALKLIERFDVTNVKPDVDESVDDLIVRLARDWNCAVATNDQKLRMKLRDIKVPIVYLRQKTHLEVEGVVT